MVINLSNPDILALREKYNESGQFSCLNVLENFIKISSKTDNHSLPTSFDIPPVFGGDTIIKQVLEDVGIPHIYFRAIFQIRDGFHIHLYDGSK